MKTQEVCTRLIEQSCDLPEMTCNDFFHSVDFFKVIESTPMLQPVMAVAEDGNGTVVGHMLALVCQHRLLYTPVKYSHCRIYGEGDYDTSLADKDTVFALLLRCLTQRLRHGLCLYVECINISSKMFGYKSFRQNHYFHIQRQEIRNSLHSCPPVKRLSDRTRRHIAAAERKGVYTQTVTPHSRDMEEAVRMLRRHYCLKPGVHVPHQDFFDGLADNSHCKMIATYNAEGRMIGTCVVVFSGSVACLLALASRRKQYMRLHPNDYTVWKAIECAYEQGARHFCFMDAGLPFRKSPLREFMLGFGGKPVSKFRWVRIPLRWFNNILDWIYNE